MLQDELNKTAGLCTISEFRVLVLCFGCDWLSLLEPFVSLSLIFSFTGKINRTNNSSLSEAFITLQSDKSGPCHPVTQTWRHFASSEDNRQRKSLVLCLIFGHYNNSLWTVSCFLLLFCLYSFCCWTLVFGRDFIMCKNATNSTDFLSERQTRSPVYFLEMKVGKPNGESGAVLEAKGIICSVSCRSSTNPLMFEYKLIFILRSRFLTRTEPDPSWKPFSRSVIMMILL